LAISLLTVEVEATLSPSPLVAALLMGVKDVSVEGGAGDCLEKTRARRLSSSPSCSSGPVVVSGCLTSSFLVVEVILGMEAGVIVGLGGFLLGSVED
jgi:hypothetical protein